MNLDSHPPIDARDDLVAVSRADASDAAAPRRRWRESPLALALLAFLATALVTGALVAVVAQAIGRQDRLAFDGQVQRVLDGMARRTTIVANLLRGTAGFVTASDDVTADDFHRYVEALQLEELHPGILGVGLTRWLRPDEVAPFEAEVHRRGRSEFHVWPMSPRPAYTSIVYLEPMNRRNAAAIGFDMYSEPVRRAAMAAALRRDGVVASGRVLLVQEIDPRKQAGFLMYLPVYHADATANRRLFGFVYSPLRVGDLLADIRGTDGRYIDYQLFDGMRVDPSALMRSTLSSDGAPAARYVVDRRLDIAGRTWTVRFYSRPALDTLSRRWLVPWMAAAALLASILLAWLTWTQARSRRNAEAATAREREDSRRKDEFLAMLAHELRNPLAPIGNAAAILQMRTPDPAQVQHSAEIIQRQVAHMTELVDDLLDVSRVTRGQITLQVERMDLRDAVRAALEQTRGLLERQHHRVTVQMPDVPLTVQGDRTRLVQVVANLLNNAAKYTPPGGEVDVCAWRSADCVCVEVRDTGIGIEPELQARLFQLFAQGRRGLDRAQGGLGIGLALVRGVVELHGGTVGARSDGPGLGSRFVVSLPAAPGDAGEDPAATHDASPPQQPRRGLSIAVVDDNADALEMMVMLLEMLGHHAQPFGTAEAALDAAGLPVDAWILDIGLPGMNGYELARRLRAHPVAARARLIALSGYGQAADREASREAGFDVHLVKPCDVDTLQAALSGVDPRA